MLGDERQQLFDDRFGPVRGDNGRKSSERQRAVGDRDAGVRKKTVDAVAASLMLEGYLTFKKR